MRRLLPLLLLCSCASMVPGGAPRLGDTLSGVAFRYAPNAVRPWPGVELAAKAISDALSARGFHKQMWIDVLGPSDEFNGPTGIGRTPYHIEPNQAGTINEADLGGGLELQPIAIVKQAQVGKPVPHACDSVIFWEVSRAWLMDTRHVLDLQHTDPDSNGLMTEMQQRCTVLRSAR